MALSSYALAPIAAQMRMPVEALVALPTAVEVFARKANMPEGQMIIELLQNAALRDYLAEICVNASREVAA